MTLRAWLAAAPLLALGCGEPPASGASAGGTLIIGTGAEADAILPLLAGTVQGKQVADALFLPLARVGDDLDLMNDRAYQPLLAERWVWAPDSLSISFSLDARARWHDGSPVRASDVRFSLAAYRAPAVASDMMPALADIDSVSVGGPLNFTVWFGQRRAAQFHDLVSSLIPIPESVYGRVPFDSLRAAGASRAPVGSGRFRFGRWLPNERLEIVADTSHWLGRAALDRVVWTVIPDQTAQVTALITGEVDMIEVLRGPALDQAARDTSLQFLRRPSFDFAHVLFNLRHPANRQKPHPVLGDRRVRRALSLGLDRVTIVRSVLDTLGVAMGSPFLSAQRVPGAATLPFDPALAAALLDSAGWRDADGNGVRDRGGQPLVINLSAPSSSQARVRAALQIQDAWKKLGVAVSYQEMQSPAMVADNEAGRFDASIMGYSGGPAPAGVVQAFRTDPTFGSNWTGYSNPEFDAALDRASHALNATVAMGEFSRAGSLLAEDAPAIWLYELRSVTGLHRRFRPAPMRPDAWWAHLDDWTVDAAQAKARDKLGVK